VDGDEPPPTPTSNPGWFSPAALKAAAKPVLKAAAAVVTLGAGASLGPEGPSVEIGASVAGAAAGLGVVENNASVSSTSSSSSSSSSSSAAAAAAKSRRLGLIAAGSAAGISAGFGAPIAGLFFAFESILQPAATRGIKGGGGGMLLGGGAVVYFTPLSRSFTPCSHRTS
jgi:H+/Cl- antiporter ClcA